MFRLHFEIFLGCWHFGSRKKLYQLSRADTGNGKLMYTMTKAPGTLWGKRISHWIHIARSRNLCHPRQEHSKARSETTSQDEVHGDSSGSSQNGLDHIFSTHFDLYLFSYQCFEYTKNSFLQFFIHAKWMDFYFKSLISTTTAAAGNRKH